MVLNLCATIVMLACQLPNASAREDTSRYQSFISELHKARAEVSPAFLAAYPQSWLCETFDRHPELLPEFFQVMADLLVSNDPATLKSLTAWYTSYLKISAPGFTQPDSLKPHQSSRLLISLIWHPRRFLSDPRFHQQMMLLLKQAMPPEVSSAIRHWFLKQLSLAPGPDLKDLEDLALAWKFSQRAAWQRELEFTGPVNLTLAEQPGKIEASFFCLPGDLIPETIAANFLKKTAELTGQRILLVLTDIPLQGKLDPYGDRIHLIPVENRFYSLWPRDAMTFFRDHQNRLVILNRSLHQLRREDDFFMVRNLINYLPEALDKRLGGVHWIQAPFEFHNGNLLVEGKTTWLALPALEPNLLRILGTDRLSPQLLQSAVGQKTLLSAVDRALAEFAPLNGGQKMSFVHPMPSGKETTNDAALLKKLMGGAGYDLDTLLTILPRDGKKSVAMVASLSKGKELIESLADAELAGFIKAFNIRVDPAQLRLILRGDPNRKEEPPLQTFLDLVAGHLASQGMLVQRLPHLVLPTVMLSNAGKYTNRDFQVGWNNLVLEKRNGQYRAEGFSSLLPGADLAVKALFSEVGYELEYLPCLTESVLRQGGYRCASKQIFEPLP